MNPILSCEVYNGPIISPDKIFLNSFFAISLSPRAIWPKVMPAWAWAKLLIRSCFSTLFPSSAITILLADFFKPFLFFFGTLRVIGKSGLILTAIFGFACVLVYASMSFYILCCLLSVSPSAVLLNAATVFSSSTGLSSFKNII